MTGIKAEGMNTNTLARSKPRPALASADDAFQLEERAVELQRSDLALCREQIVLEKRVGSSLRCEAPAPEVITNNI